MRCLRLACVGGRNFCLELVYWGATLFCRFAYHGFPFSRLLRKRRLVAKNASWSGGKCKTAFACLWPLKGRSSGIQIPLNVTFLEVVRFSGIREAWFSCFRTLAQMHDAIELCQDESSMQVVFYFSRRGRTKTYTTVSDR